MNVDVEQFLPEGPRRWRRVEYERLVELGVFDEDEHLELLYGTVVQMTPQKPPHAWVLSWLPEQLIATLRGRALVRVQLPLALTEDSEPEPDVAVVQSGDYRTAHPTRALLIVEVAETSVRKDVGIKARLYAEAGVPEYWVVNLAANVVLVHRRTNGKTYEDVASHRDGDLHLVAFPEVAIPVNQLLGG
jgi:Uma2 family endonuclease